MNAQHQPTKQDQQHKMPYILSSLLSSVNSVASSNGNPEKFDGLVFFSAEKNERRKGYHVVTKNTIMLNQNQIDRILQIVNEGRENPLTFERPARKPQIKQQQ